MQVKEGKGEYWLTLKFGKMTRVANTVKNPACVVLIPCAVRVHHLNA